MILYVCYKTRGLLYFTLKMVQIGAMTVLTVLTALAVLASIVIPICINFDLGRRITNTDNNLAAFEDTTADNIESLNTNISNLNTSLCTKIMDVNTTLQTELDMIFSVLNFTNQTGMNFTMYVINSINDLEDNVTILFQQDALINSTFTNITELINIMLGMVKQNISDLNTTLVDGNTTIWIALNALTDTVNNVTIITIPAIQTNITNLQNSVSALVIAISQTIKTINLVLPVSQNMDLVSGTPYSLVINSTGAGVINFYVNAITTINGLGGSAGALYVAGTGGITINNTAAPDTVTVDGSTLVTAITNLQQEDVNQDAALANLTATDVSLQTQINNLNMTGQMIAMALNGTTITFNMTLMTLVNDVMTLMSQVAILQAQVANLTSVATPTGTIVPWGGSATLPTGYLACDGSMVAIATYADLYAVVGCKFCSLMTCTMTDFCLPDLRGKLPVAQSATGGSAFNVPPGTSNVGEEKHTLTTTELPSHSHTYVTSSAGGHGHDLMLGASNGINDANNNGIYDFGDTIAVSYAGTGFRQHLGTAGSDSLTGEGSVNSKVFFDHLGSPNNGASPVPDHTHSGSTATTGSGTAHNVVQPAVVVAAYMIKT